MFLEAGKMYEHKYLENASGELGVFDVIANETFANFNTTRIGRATYIYPFGQRNFYESLLQMTHKTYRH